MDAYIFPCFSCGNPRGQMNATVSTLRNGGAEFGMIWLDIGALPGRCEVCLT